MTIHSPFTVLGLWLFQLTLLKNRCSAVRDQRFLGDVHLEPMRNANHIFNAIHSSMRQWGSSLNHNGMSVFPALVPRGTVLYHGSDAEDRVEGTEWVAFEQDHALQFAHLFVAPTPLPPLDEDHHRRQTQRGTFGYKSQVISTRYRSLSDPDLIWIIPGYLHSYYAKRDLRLLYLDGSAAAKSLRGTLDVSDILLRNQSKARPDGDIDRALELCQLARTIWGGKVDGFIRMEAGFEVILCSFAESLEFTNAMRTQDIFDEDAQDEKANVFHWLRAAASRFDGIGGFPSRVSLNYNSFLTAYDYPLDLFRDGRDNLPRLTAAPQDILQTMRDDLQSMITRPSTFKRSEIITDWQAVADMIVQKYAAPLQYIIHSPEFAKSGTRLARELNMMLRPFVDYSHREMDIEIDRCAAEHTPTLSCSNGRADLGSLAQRAITAVSCHICSTLVNVLWSLQDDPSKNPNDPVSDPSRPLATIKILVEYLSWTTWKKCKGCSWDQICSVPMFPFGAAEDLAHPRCRSARDIGRAFDYWGR